MMENRNDSESSLPSLANLKTWLIANIGQYVPCASVLALSIWDFYSCDEEKCDFYIGKISNDFVRITNYRFPL